MLATLESPTMAKAKGRPKTSERDDVSVKLDRGLVLKAKQLAADRKIPLAELLTDMLTEPVDRAYAQLLRKYQGKG